MGEAPHSGRAPSGQALVSDGAPADRHPSRFDPSRMEEIMGALSWCFLQCESIMCVSAGASQTGGDLRDALQYINSLASDVMINLETIGEKLRDSDGNPEGGDSEAAPSRSDDSADPQGIANNSNDLPSPPHTREGTE